MRIRKGIILLVTIGAVFISITGCVSSTQMNIKTDEESVSKPVGISGLQKLDDGLHYDQTTGIVYWWNGSFGARRSATMPTPYYSENGKLYRYDPVSNTMEEIR